MRELYITRRGLYLDILVQSDDEELMHAVRCMYQPFISEFAPAQKQLLRLSVYEKDSSVYFECNNIKTEIPKEYALQAMENAVYENTKVDDEFIALHAAAVARDGKAFIFTGNTGAGKSTLCAFLTANGYEYLSDDIVLIKKSSVRLMPYKNPMSLRPGSVDILTNCGIDTSSFTEVRYGGIHRYIKDVSPETRYTEYNVGGIFFIDRNTQINSYNRLSPFSSFPGMLKSQLTPNVNSQDNRIINELIGAGAYGIRYIDMAYVNHVILSHFI